MKDPVEVLLRPIVSEKSYALMEDGVYIFAIAPDATKIDVRHAVETAFGVRVVKVNTLNRKGKRKRHRRQPKWGKRADTKRAIVTLSDGDRIPLFEGGN